MTRPFAIDLFCGLGGWTEGLLAEGWYVIGFDIEQHTYGGHRYPAQLVIQDVLTLHGSQFKDAALIVASPPCQEYSYMAMPWSRAKVKAAAIRADATGKELERLNRLFNACFRIQREACEAAGRHIPMVMENVRGAIPWVGRSRYNFGSYHLWGDVPALMPVPRQEGVKVAGFRFDGSGRSFQSASVAETGCSLPGGDSFKVGFQQTAKLRMEADEGRKIAKDGLGGYSGDFGWDDSPMRRGSSKSTARKAASAMIAKIPLPLSTWIARCFLPHAPRPLLWM